MQTWTNYPLDAASLMVRVGMKSRHWTLKDLLAWVNTIWIGLTKDGLANRTIRKAIRQIRREDPSMTQASPEEMLMWALRRNLVGANISAETELTQLNIWLSRASRHLDLFDDDEEGDGENSSN